jgi:hypothetical protein
MRKTLTPYIPDVQADLLPKVGFLLVALVMLLLIPARALAATKVWDGGCGEDRAWSCAANWRGDVVPSAGDTAAFNARSTGVSSVDPGFGGKVAAVRLLPGYPGTVVLDRSLTVSKGFVQRDGAFAAGTHALAVQTLLLLGGSFEASSATTSVGATLKVSGSPEFDANGGTLVVAGTSGKLTCAGIAFNRVLFANTAKTKTVEPSCDLPLGDDPTAGAGGSIKLNGTLSGSGTLSSTELLTLGPTGELSGFSALDADSLTVNGPHDFGGYAGLSVAETFLLGATGDFTAPAGTASFGGRFKVPPAAEFDANGGTVVFDGAANSSIFCGDKAFNLVRFEQVGAVKNVEKDCSLPLGGDPTLGDGGGATVRLAGSLSGSGTLAVDGALTLTKPSRLTGFAGLEVAGDLEVAGATADLDSYFPFAVDGSYSQVAGKVVAPDGADFGGAFALGPRASFEAPSGTMSVGGDFGVDWEATFDANGGTVVLDGSGQTVTGSTTFNNLTKIAGSSDALSFGSGSTQTVLGTLKLQGKNAGNLLELVPTTSGSPWRLDNAGSAEVKFVSVADSTNIGTPIAARESKNGGGNSGWSISATATRLVLEAQATTSGAGASDNLTIVAKDAYGSTAASYTGSHNLTFGPVADSPSGAHATVTNFAGGGSNFGVPTQINFVEGVATVSSGRNGAMTLVKAGSTSVTVGDGSISNGSGLAIAVSPGSAERLAWTNVSSSGELDSPCLFTCTGKQLGKSGNFKARVAVADTYGNVVGDLGAGHKVSIASDHGSIGGGSLTLASTGPAESTTQFTYTPGTGGTTTVTANTSAGTTYQSATASLER